MVKKRRLRGDFERYGIQTLNVGTDVSLHLENHLELTSNLTWPDHQMMASFSTSQPWTTPCQVSHRQLQGGSSWVNESTG